MVTLKKSRNAEEYVRLPEKQAVISKAPFYKPEHNVLFTQQKQLEEQPVMNEKNKNLISKNSFMELMNGMETDFKIASYSVYFISGKSAPQKICGESIDNLAIEQYLSYSHTVVLVNPDGIFHDRAYKSRYITSIYTGNGTYLICISSYSFEAFRDAGAVSEKICALCSEVGYEFSSFV